MDDRRWDAGCALALAGMVPIGVGAALVPLGTTWPPPTWPWSWWWSSWWRRRWAGGWPGRWPLSRRPCRRIRRVADLVARGAPAAEVIAAAEAQLTELLSLASCRFDAGPSSGSLPRLERSGTLAGVHLHRTTPEGFELPSEGVDLAVLSRGQQVGRFLLVSRPGVGVSLDQRVVAVALADQVGSALGGRDSSPGGRGAATSGQPEGTKR